MRKTTASVPEIIRRSSVGLALAPCHAPGTPQAAALQPRRAPGTPQAAALQPRRAPGTPQAAALQPRRAAFTLIELLVAVAILLIIVAIVAQIFQQANVAWETGKRNVEATMKGRAVADIIAQELAQAIPSNGSYSVTAAGASFIKLGRADATNSFKALQPVAFSWSGGAVSRDGVPMAEGVDNVEVEPTGGTMPKYVTVTVTISNHIFQARAFMQNRERYSY